MENNENPAIIRDELLMKLGKIKAHLDQLDDVRFALESMVDEQIEELQKTTAEPPVAYGPLLRAIDRAAHGKSSHFHIGRDGRVSPDDYPDGLWAWKPSEEAEYAVGVGSTLSSREDYEGAPLSTIVGQENTYFAATKVSSNRWLMYGQTKHFSNAEMPLLSDCVVLRWGTVGPGGE